MPLALPDFALVVLMGAAGAGKSDFAARHFAPTEVVQDLDAAAERLAARALAVLDAPHVRPEDRHGAVRLARRFHAPAVALALDLPAALCDARNRARHPGARSVRGDSAMLHAGLPGLAREGFGTVHVLASAEAVAAAALRRRPLACDLRRERGPFDVVGDVHGCDAELAALLAQLGYADGGGAWRHPAGRRAVFVGDLVHRGPGVVAVLRRVMAMVAAGSALCVASNHDDKLARKLHGRDVAVGYGLAESLAQLDALPAGEQAAFRVALRDFIDARPSHAWLDGGALVVAHAGLGAALHGRESAAVRAFCLFGDTTGVTDAQGYPVRQDWAAGYRGDALVAYGHTVVPQPRWVGNTVCVDTGCVFGGSLSALRYPERTVVSVPAARAWWPRPAPGGAII